jgi:L-alanine-DL-glutamate epimerase-like enolase superfamily enzyme
MKIDKINIYNTKLPLKVNFPHSLNRSSSVCSTIVEIIAEKGRVRGYGEGTPRSYVTGETSISVSKSISNFIQQRKFPWVIHDPFQLWSFVDDLPDEKMHNSAICSLESALLDALGKYQQRHILDYFPKDFYTDTLFYGAALPLTNKTNISLACQLIKEMKIHKLKLKMGKDFDENKMILQTVNSCLENRHDLKVDVNCVWNTDIAVQHLSLFQKYRVKVLEQPVMPGDPQIREISTLVKSSGIVLMADESACTLADVQQLSRNNSYDIVNIRLSKCGGFRKSLKMIDYLRQNGIAFQIGCHLGESGILSAAGRVLNLLCCDALYYDGSYDEFLLRENVTVENVSFGKGGKAHQLNGPGLGISINLENLRRLSNGKPIVTLLRP